MVKEIEHVINVLRDCLEALKKKDSSWLRDLSDKTIHTSSINQDSGNIALAVIIYSLSKIVERRKYHEQEGWESFYASVISSLEFAIDSLEEKNEIKFNEEIKKIRVNIEGLSGDLKDYIEDVFRKAKINKASKIYEHGISMEQTARILGISLWELSSYTGAKPDSSDNVYSNTVEIKDRVKFLEGFF